MPSPSMKPLHLFLNLFHDVLHEARVKGLTQGDTNTVYGYGTQSSLPNEPFIRSPDTMTRITALFRSHSISSALES